MSYPLGDPEQPPSTLLGWAYKTESLSSLKTESAVRVFYSFALVVLFRSRSLGSLSYSCSALVLLFRYRSLVSLSSEFAWIGARRSRQLLTRGHAQSATQLQQPLALNTANPGQNPTTSFGAGPTRDTKTMEKTDRRNAKA